MLRILLLISLLLALPCRSQATGQVPDRLLYRGDTLDLFANPLEAFFELNPPRPENLVYPEGCELTACWRGYQATWELENGQLYLLELQPCCPDDARVSTLRRWFLPDARGRIAATWVTGFLRVPQGKLLRYVHMGYGSTYEQDLELFFCGGRLLLQRTADNRATRIGLYERNPEECQRRILRAVHWQRLPADLDRAGGKVFVQVRADSLGRPAHLTVVKGLGAPFDAEAVRAVSSIKEWSALYVDGRWQPATWTIPVHFSAENRRRYGPGKPPQP